MTTAERLTALRQLLAERDYDALVIPRADEHLGEYIPLHNERLLWATGFTGSAGMAVVRREGAGIFVDGRYTVQVRQQVPAADFSYHHLLEEPPLQWLLARLQPGARVAVDPRLHNLQWLRQAEAELAAGGLVVCLDTDNLVDRCWQDRPAAQIEPALLLDESHTGESSVSKRTRIGAAVKAQGADGALVFAPDSVSWLLNLRGRDVPCLPVLQSLALLWADGSVDLVVESARMPAGWQQHCGGEVRLHAPAEAEALLGAQAGKRVLADPVTANAWSQRLLEQGGATLVAGTDPALMPKACKNPVEIAGARAAHIRDGAAVIRFLAWLDAEQAAGRLYDEAELADRLLGFRSGGEHFQGPSFDTISAAGSNAAMCHYNHRNGTPARLPPDSAYLVDSGAQYTDGTTDITRTVAIGDPGAEVRRLFTLVLKGHIALDQARFPKGTTGTHLDVLARQYLWREGHDYDHGTGHGVGAFLSVHEGPQRIAKAWAPVPLQPGMIVSNEPGYYRDGAFGIRCENLVVVTEVAGELETPMYGFEALTLVPFDRRLLDLALLDAREQQWLDAYHVRVASAVGPLLSATDRAWLQQACAPLAADS
ncbi:aminopeptidase P family protein [Haliea sp. E1-2-M8]|uniref:aminopeptidase P family protein n=1 Tax=Haliea sp. E1-2-M8 TaxID=3064706 RepID=UPI00272684D0|nr:aminopeptidase P family protein [Haliea sp. E1-2-M8]MDO8862216.1 aminopeptidase P family protein [Haliea sp. E1-2-M8]